MAPGPGAWVRFERGAYEHSRSLRRPGLAPPADSAGAATRAGHDHHLRPSAGHARQSDCQLAAARLRRRHRPRPLFGRGSFVLNMPEAIRHVLVDNYENYARTPFAIRVLRPILGEGLLTAEG